MLFWVIITGTSNGMNLIDGLDGLSTGASILVFAAYTLVNIWQNNQSCATTPGGSCYEVRDPLDLAVIAAAITGACFGFLWWNAHRPRSSWATPARWPSEARWPVWPS